MTTRTQLSTIVSPKIRQAYSRLGEMTGLNLTDLLTAAVPRLERHFGQADLVAGYVQLARWGDLDSMSHCPECDQPFGDLTWVAVRANGDADPPVCGRCATSE